MVIEWRLAESLAEAIFATYDLEGQQITDQALLTIVMRLIEAMKFLQAERKWPCGDGDA